MSEVWVRGRPALFMGSGETAWKELLRGCGFHSERPAMHFTVEGWTRGGNYFDLENLVTPVLTTLALTPAALWATVGLGGPEGVRLSEQSPPRTPDVPAFCGYLAKPPRASRNGLEAPAELLGVDPVGRDEPVGLELLFDDPDERFGPYGFTGSAKPVIDALGPLLGWRGAKRGGPADDRIRDLRIRRGANPGASGVRVTMWQLLDSANAP